MVVSRRASVVIASVVAAAAIAAVIGVVGSGERGAPADASGSSEAPAAAHFGGRHQRTNGAACGVGWSSAPVTAVAASEAFSTAIAGSVPDLVCAYFSPQMKAADLWPALQRTRKGARLLGESTHVGILTEDGFHQAATGTLGVLSLQIPGTTVGVGGAGFDEADAADAAALAYERALADAGPAVSGPPNAIVLCVTLPSEERTLEGLERVAPGVPVIGGTAAGALDALGRKRPSTWTVVANDKVLNNGLGVALLWTASPPAIAYGGGYRRTGRTGAITRCLPRLILEIDGRPAETVYDEWLDGRLGEARRRGDDLVNFCTLYPLCRALPQASTFVRAWPSDDPAHPGSLRTASELRTGDRVCLSEGTWNLLLNTFGSVPRAARDGAAASPHAAALFIYCGGALECIPQHARPQMSGLVDRALHGMPWLGVFTWGEQGPVPGVANLHSNLSSGAIVFASTR